MKIEISEDILEAVQEVADKHNLSTEKALEEIINIFCGLEGYRDASQTLAIVDRADTDVVVAYFEEEMFEKEDRNRNLFQ